MCKQRLDGVAENIEYFQGDIAGSSPGIGILFFSKFRLF